MATCATVESPEVMVTDELIPVQEFDRVKNAVCLLRPSTSDPSKSWSATGFYADVNLKKRDDKENVHCIMTNYHVFCKMKQHDHTVAVFHHDGTQKKHVEIPIMPFALLASSKELDYVLIGIDKSKMQSIGVKPILADISQLPIVKKHDKVFIIQHPKGMMKHFSQDTVKHVNKPFLEYNADTLEGSSGSPVFVVKESKFFLVALHSKGVKSYPSNWNKGVLFSEILNHLLTGKVTKPYFLPTGIPDQMESDVNFVGVPGTEDLFKERFKRWKDVKIRYAIMGDSGAGKSTFINAIRGIGDDDNDAAKVDVTEEATEPKEYVHPENPNISFVHLPGIGARNYPDLSTYLKKVGLTKYDTFLIFTATRFTQNDLQLAEKVKSIGKSFFLIRTKIDVDLTPKKGKARVDEEATLRKIRNNCMDNVKGLTSSEKEVFLISNYDKDKWDFDRLIEAISEMPALEKQDQTTFLTDDEYLSDLKAHIDENGVSNIQDFLSKKLEGWKDVKIRVGVTGDSGTGKSAFINAIRGLNDDQYDKGAATVGETETTTEPKEYQHPDNPKIIFVDLPGIGTPNYSDIPTYCEKVSLEDYDTFLIFTATRFTKNDLDLAKKVKGIGKSFFLIRTKIDVDLTPKKGKAPIDEDKILRKIKSKCLKNVEGLISDESEIFLIGNYDKDKWDFDRLINAIGDKLHTYQKECLTLSLSNVTRECLKRKARFLKVQAIVVALASAATGKIPIPGVQGAINGLLIRSTLRFYQTKFGLHNMSEGLSLSSEGHKDRIEHFLSAIASNSSIVGFERISKSYPSIGKAIESILSFTLTLRFLSLKIDDFEKAALAAWDNATKQSIQDSSQTSTNSDSSTQ